MYFVKIESTGEARTMWTDDHLKKAIEECDMRTHATQTPHVVTDENGLRLHLSLPQEARQRPAVKREERQTVLAILGVVILITAWAIWVRWR